MKYVDSGTRDASQTLAQWFTEVLDDDVSELRIQTGFFSLDALTLYTGCFERLARENAPCSVLIGSNDCSTLHDDVVGLVELMGIPRTAARLGVISYSGGAYFHPKAFHVRRLDGSEAAFVGSANLTPSGLALHVEAGIALDTRDGDSPEQLANVRAAIDAWFSDERPGITLITGLDVVGDLAAQGILSLAPPVRPSGEKNNGVSSATRGARPRLDPLIAIPRATTKRTREVDEAELSTRAEIVVEEARSQTASPANASAPREGFPPYLRFDPHAIGATKGWEALTGVQLPAGAVGLILQLNRDSARHFMGGSGTANISIPVATIATLRFGTYGKHNRPRAEYQLRIRYLGDGVNLNGGTVDTNIMGYGFAPTESGHGDIRMLVPREVMSLGHMAAESGQPLPKAGDFALLEWPSPDDRAFRLTFMNPTSLIARAATRLFNESAASGGIVGHGACWLPASFSPTW